MVQRLSAVATLVFAMLVLLVASAQHPATHAEPPPLPRSEFARHPQVIRADREFLARAGGWLWWVDQRCQAAAINLATRQVRRVEGEHCKFWPNPQGTIALATVGGATDSTDERRLVVIDLTDPRVLRQVSTVHLGGALHPPVVWNQSGDTAAFCIATARSLEVIRVKAFAWDQHQTRNACTPVWVDGDKLAVVRGDRVIVDGTAAPLDALLERTTRGRPSRITALAASPEPPSYLAIGVARRAQFGLAVPPAALVVADGHGRGINIRPGDAEPFPEVGIAPDGSAAWYRDINSGSAFLTAGVRLRPFPAEIPTQAWSYAWAEGGAYVAVAERNSIHVFDWRTGASATVSGVAARDLAWVR